MTAFELKKEPINISRQLLDSFSQTVIESDVIIPDTKPDIQKILQVDTLQVISDKNVMPDKVKLHGYVTATVLYITDRGEIRSMTAELPFEHTANVKGAEPEMFVECECDVKNIQETIINSRKINLKLFANMLIRLTKPQTLEVCTGVNGACETLTQTINTAMLITNAQSDIPVRDNLELPSNKQSAGAILKADGMVIPKETRVINNKVVCKGILALSLLYLCDKVDAPVQDVSLEMPFTEVIDAYGVDESMNCTADYGIKSLDWELREDGDGDNRIITVSAMLTVSCMVTKPVTHNVLCDMYSTKQPIELKRNTANVDKTVAEMSIQSVLKDAINLPHDLPEVAIIYNVMAKPVVTQVTIEEDKAIISGEIEGYIQYLSASEQSPVNKYKFAIPFKETVSVEGARDGMNAEVGMSIQEITHNVGLGWNVELKFIIDMNLQVIEPTRFEYVTEAEGMERNEDEETRKGFVVKIYFVQPNDTPWKIAKKYRASIKDILEANDLDEQDSLKPGMQMIIPA